MGTKKDAGKALVDELARIGSDTFVAPDRTTFGQYLRAFLDGARPTYARKTWERFDQMARMHVTTKIGDVPLQRLRVVHLTKAYAEWRKAGLSAQSVVHHHRLIHRTLAQALAEGRIRQNVASTMAKLKPKAPKAQTRALSTDEIVRLIAAVAGTPYAPLVMMALATGARRGELLGIKWDDVDLGRRTLAIRRSLEETKDNGVAEKLPKSGKARVVQLPESAVEALRAYRIAQGRIGPGYVFPGPDGGAWSPNDASDGFRRYVKRARIGRASLHTLRHTCASQLLAQGVHPKVVQEMLGHSTIAITMDLYSHVTPSLQAEAAGKLDTVLRSAFAGALAAGA